MATRSIGEADRLSQPIPGDYQFRALWQGSPVQRFWHRNKRLVLDLALGSAGDAVVLDVGCGSGNQTQHLGASAGLAIGMDASAAAVGFAATQRIDKRIHGFSGLDRFGSGGGGDEGVDRGGGVGFVRGIGEAIPLADGSVTAAVLIEVIEHLERPETTLAEIRRVLVPGGRLVVTTPNYGWPSPWPVLEWLLDRSGRVPRMAGEQHVSRFDRGRLGEALEAAGFVVEVVGTFYLISPLLALVSAGWADEVAAREIARAGPGGALLFAVARRRDP